jgi:ASC-1-like (ASCH) protein
MHMRDMPWDAPIPTGIKADTSYHEESLKDACEDYFHWRGMSMGDKIMWVRDSIDRQIRDYESYAEKNLAENSIYDAARERLLSWDVPEEIKQFKIFLLQQIETSYNRDPNYYAEQIKNLQAYDPFEYMEQHERGLLHTIQHNAKSIQEELDRAKKNNSFLVTALEAIERL